MLMHVNAKKTAFGGLMLAITVVCITLGSVIETNTLFLLAAASFFIGIAVQETNLAGGGAFYLAGVLLGLLVSPNKLYVVSYAGMGLYILAVECVWRRLGRMERDENRRRLFWLAKYLIFNLMYLPVLWIFRRTLLAAELPKAMWIVIVLAGQAGLLVYDRAYEYFMGKIWKKIRGKLF